MADEPMNPAAPERLVPRCDCLRLESGLFFPCVLHRRRTEPPPPSANDFGSSTGGDRGSR